MPRARARRVPTESVSPRAAIISAILFTVARNQIASPAAAFATTVFKPSSESELKTSWVVRARSARSAASAGSASRIAADKIEANRGHGIIPTKSLRA
jgi:hypothetical protein